MLDVTIILPVYNEEKIIENSVREVYKKMLTSKKNFEIIVADNTSNDRTPEIVKKLEKTISQVKYFYIDTKGRGIALRKTIKEKARGKIVVYMDADLSTDLKHLPEIIKTIEDGNDFSTGSRLMKKSEVIGRKLSREIFSRGYNFLCRLIFNDQIKDHQCGFKAFNRESFLKIVDDIKDNYWFFDTELLIRGKRKGFSVVEIPVKWVDDQGTTVKVKKDVIQYLKDIPRLYLDFLRGD